MCSISKQMSEKHFIYWPYKISTKELLKRRKLESVEDNIKKIRRSYIWAHIMKRGKHKGSNDLGSRREKKKNTSKETCQRTVERETQEMRWSSLHKVQYRAKDGDKWKKMCTALCSTGRKDIICLFFVLGHFQHCTGHITTGSWEGRGNQYIQLVKVLYCKLPTNGKQLPAFPLEVGLGTKL